MSYGQIQCLRKLFSIRLVKELCRTQSLFSLEVKFLGHLSRHMTLKKIISDCNHT